MRIKKSVPFLITLLLLTLAHTARADEDPFAPNFFSPELVMSHQADIALKDSQRQLIIDGIKKTQSDMIDVQFKMKAVTQELVNLIKTPKVDEAKAIAALHKLTKVEDEMKTLHVTMMIRIKNALTKEQQDKLKTFSK